VSSDPIELMIRETTEADLGFVIDAGSDADARHFMAQWPRPRHRDAIARAPARSTC
jgi:hypothetical protein